MSADPQRSASHLETVGLSAGYGGDAIIHELGVEVNLGETVAVIGPNGAGKSTLLRAITGRIPAMKGTIWFNGVPIHGLRADERVRRGIGYVPQVKDVFENLTARENLEMGGFLVAKKERRERLDEVVGMFPLLSALLPRTAGKLSGGERKVLAIARVLMLRPTLLILDEPTANLAPALADEVFRQHIPGLAARNRAILLVEQRARQALEIADRSYVMVDGHIHLSGPARELLGRADIRQVFLGQSAS